MDRFFIMCVTIVILIFIFFMFCNQDSPKFKNCLSADNTVIDVQHVSIDGECPSGTKTCPQYFGCDNANIPFCRNKNEDGDYEGISCPKCVDGQWECDFFMMGNNHQGISNPQDWTQLTCDQSSSQEVSNCQFNNCRSLGDDCKWGWFNTGGNLRYSDKGVPSDSNVSGYKVSMSGNTPFFKLSFDHDAGENLGGVVKTLSNVSLQECIAGAQQPYTYDQNKVNGSYGFVYDSKNSSCDLHRIGDGVPWNYSTAKFVKGG
jgi:hypothetical protein